MFQLIGLAVIGALLAVTVKTVSPEHGFLLSVAVVCAIMFIALASIRPVIEYASELAGTAGLSGEVFAPLLKALGIAILTRVASELCRDAKELGVAAGVELGGAALILFVSMPLLRAVLYLMNSIL